MIETGTKDQQCSQRLSILGVLHQFYFAAKELIGVLAFLPLPFTQLCDGNIGLHFSV